MSGTDAHLCKCPLRFILAEDLNHPLQRVELVALKVLRYVVELLLDAGPVNTSCTLNISALVSSSVQTYTRSSECTGTAAPSAEPGGASDRRRLLLP